MALARRSLGEDWCAWQDSLRYAFHATQDRLLILASQVSTRSSRMLVVRLAGLEPAAYRLGICRSIHLSYRRINFIVSLKLRQG